MHIDFSHLSIGTFLAVYAAGFITSLTPCVYPIIPIVVGFLGSRSGGFGSRAKGAVLYTLGLAFVYTALGMVAALTGKIFGTLTANSYVFGAFGLLILVLGGNMMEWYIIPIPGFKVTMEGEKESFFTPFIVGMSTGLVASPCTAPVLGGLLMFVAATKAVVKGGLLMFTFSVGMSTLLLIIGFSASLISFLPKSGQWMVTVKKVLALILICAGLYFVFLAGKLS